MDLTTLAKVQTLDKSYVDATQETLDMIEMLITSVSAMVEKYLDRTILIGTYTEKFNLTSYCNPFLVKAWPITSVTSVVNDDYTIPSSDIEYEAGRKDRVAINDNILLAGYGRLTITYTGGMATDTADFVANFPDIEMEVIKQVLFEAARVKTVGVKSITIDEQTTTLETNNLLPSTRRLLNSYKRKVQIV